LRLILHIGPHKTGTTSLQKALRKTYCTNKRFGIRSRLVLVQGTHRWRLES